jgi:serine/threonine-protein kinase RsbW
VKATPVIFRLTLPSRTQSIRRVEPYLNKINAAAKLDEVQFNKLMVSVTEAVNNAIIHGNKLDPAKKVRIVAEMLPGWLVVMVTDEGRGFKPAAVKSPLKKTNLLKDSGRGLFLMRTLMDKVEYEINATGTQVRLWLDLTKPSF